MRLIEEKTVDFIPSASRCIAADALSQCFDLGSNLYKLRVYKSASVLAEVGETVVGSKENPVELKSRILCA